MMVGDGFERWLGVDDDALRALGDEEAEEIAAWVEGELERLAAPIRPTTDDAQRPRRRKLQLLAAFLFGRRGDRERAAAMALDAFVVAGPVAPVLRRLCEARGEEFAAAFGRIALASDECPDREEVAAIVDRVARVPDGWEAAVAAFAAAPSEAAWDALMLFVSEDLHYERKRSLIRRTLELGVDPNVVFRCAARGGATSDLIGLVQDGKVDVAVVEAHARRSGAKAIWLGQAAEAALAHGGRSQRMGVSEGAGLGSLSREEACRSFHGS